MVKLIIEYSLFWPHSVGDIFQTEQWGSQHKRVFFVGEYSSKYAYHLPWLSHSLSPKEYLLILTVSPFWSFWPHSYHRRYNHNLFPLIGSNIWSVTDPKSTAASGDCFNHVGVGTCLAGHVVLRSTMIRSLLPIRTPQVKWVGSWPWLWLPVTLGERCTHSCGMPSQLRGVRIGGGGAT